MTATRLLFLLCALSLFQNSFGIKHKKRQTFAQNSIEQSKEFGIFQARYQSIDSSFWNFFTNWFPFTKPGYKSINEKAFERLSAKNQKINEDTTSDKKMPILNSLWRKLIALKRFFQQSMRL